MTGTDPSDPKRHRSFMRALTLLSSVLIAGPVSAQTVGDVFASVSEAVVIIKTTNTEYPLLTTELPVAVPGTGSGVLISPTEVMTAAHVVQAADEILIEFKNGETARAVVTASRTTHDVALLQLDVAASVSPAELGDSDAVEVGEQVFVVGAPFGQGHTLTVGYVSARRSPVGLMGGNTAVDFIHTDAAINPGNSGGPMFNRSGQVVGIVSHILTLSGGFQGLGYAVAANTARTVLLEQPSLWTGVEGKPITGVIAALLNVPPPGGGVLVEKVAAGSAAEALGLRPSTVPAQIAGQELLIGGDIILSVQGIEMGGALEGWETIQRAISTLPRGSAVSVVVLRHGELLEIRGTLPN
ncbi:MAG: S1C family serine protease [Longimicrobiales bacterium]